MCLMSISLLQAQTNNAEVKVIAFGDKLTGTDIGLNINQEFDYKVFNADKNTIVFKGTGAALYNIVFSTPGKYRIEFNLNSNHKETACDHGKETIRFNFVVSPIKMDFDFSRIKFSKEIKKGISADNTTITVPVKVQTFNHQSYEFSPANFSVSGIGSDITAMPMETKIVLNEGENLLQYKLSGTAKSEAYLMFDFVDANNNVQSYSLSEPIK